MITGQDWLSDLEKINKANNRFLKSSVGEEHVLEGISISLDTNARYKINDVSKPYAIKISGEIDGKEKILTLSTQMGDIGIQILGKALKEKGIDLQGNTLIFKHPSNGSLILESDGVVVKMTCDEKTKKISSKVEGADSPF